MKILHDDLLLEGNIKNIIDESAEHYEKPLKLMPSAQAVVHKYYDKNGYIILAILQSYNTLVCAIDFNNNKLYCNGTYSQTTRKHISAFAKQFTSHCGFSDLSYYSFKELIKA